ncbi:MAG: glycosyltransferase [Ruminococcaceae bacterium]|nr:glycosyltransferase [Oscillospiraceae bacterium]
MKFLIYIPQLIFGGAEKVLVSFANYLVSHGHEVEVLELYEKGLLKPQFDNRVKFNAICSSEYTNKYYASLAQIKSNPSLKGKLTGCCKLTFSKIVGYRQFAEKLAAKHYKNKKYDVAINYLETEPPTFLLKNIKAKKYIQWYHIDVANMAHPEKSDSIVAEYDKLDAVICVAESARINFIKRYPQLESKTYTIYNFFDTDTIIEKGDNAFSYREECFKMLSVGRMTEQKKYLRFLGILAKLKEQGYIFSWHILGTGVEYDAIVRKIEELGLDECVYLDGVTDNPYKYMKNCDLFVLPSGWEGFPTVTVEAKVLGCAVLATDVSGIREQLLHGETGWIVENSEEGLYNGLKYLVDNPVLVEKIRNNAGMEHILNNDSKFAKFEEIYLGK